MSSREPAFREPGMGVFWSLLAVVAFVHCAMVERCEFRRPNGDLVFAYERPDECGPKMSDRTEENER